MGDIRLFLDTSDPIFLSKNSGVICLKEPNIDFENYKSGVFIPKLDFEVLDMVGNGIATSNKNDLGRTVYIGQFDEKVNDYFFGEYIKHITEINVQYEQEIINKLVLKNVEQFVLNLLNKKKNVSFNKYSSAIQATNKQIIRANAVSGYDIVNYSSTQNPNSPFKLRGLHIDNWQIPRFCVSKRHLAGVKLGLNIGLQKRDVMFIDSSVSLMAQVLQNAGDKQVKSFLHGDFATPIGEMFMLYNPLIPVYKFTLAPNSYYIMPVQNMVHDGFPFLQNYTDYNFMMSFTHFNFL
ncbi:hypothetical protein ACFP1I_22205 [Dyadobacter subterraneus]|uniref:DUF4238 domain-containing protein n=1 Tax=Dyadobacter subterraneus TaxID=2773304 RepID=A0ABR9WJ25_9BACT|nr:hypothetical protein [Dyadobacter subterraneus]MBE9465518.1 hypothetical protein [Dyadobacter subterraneus]